MTKNKKELKSIKTTTKDLTNKASKKTVNSLKGAREELKGAGRLLHNKATEVRAGATPTGKFSKDFIEGALPSQSAPAPTPGGATGAAIDYFFSPAKELNKEIRRTSSNKTTVLSHSKTIQDVVQGALEPGPPPNSPAGVGGMITKEIITEINQRNNK